jgi:hypothetical protein
MGNMNNINMNVPMNMNLNMSAPMTVNASVGSLPTPTTSTAAVQMQMQMPNSKPPMDSRATTTTPNSGKSNSKTKNTKKVSAFVSKLYSMLHDPSVSHLIWWSRLYMGDFYTFALLPGTEFASILTNYFKHGNVASFVRQLHMYGFHKVCENNPPHLQSDNDNGKNSGHGHTHGHGHGHVQGNHAVWEFRHTTEKFRKDGLDSLHLIKRRANSRRSSANSISSTNSNNSESALNEQPVTNTSTIDVNGEPFQGTADVRNITASNQAPAGQRVVYKPVYMEDTDNENENENADDDDDDAKNEEGNDNDSAKDKLVPNLKRKSYTEPLTPAGNGANHEITKDDNPPTKIQRTVNNKNDNDSDNGNNKDTSNSPTEAEHSKPPLYKPSSAQDIRDIGSFRAPSPRNLKNPFGDSQDSLPPPLSRTKTPTSVPTAFNQPGRSFSPLGRLSPVSYKQNLFFQESRQRYPSVLIDPCAPATAGAGAGVGAGISANSAVVSIERTDTSSPVQLPSIRPSVTGKRSTSILPPISALSSISGQSMSSAPTSNPGSTPTSLTGPSKSSGASNSSAGNRYYFSRNSSMNSSVGTQLRPSIFELHHPSSGSSISPNNSIFSGIGSSISSTTSSARFGSSISSMLNEDRRLPSLSGTSISSFLNTPTDKLLHSQGPTSISSLKSVATIAEGSETEKENMDESTTTTSHNSVDTTKEESKKKLMVSDE